MENCCNYIHVSYRVTMFYYWSWISWWHKWSIQDDRSQSLATTFTQDLHWKQRCTVKPLLTWSLYPKNLSKLKSPLYQTWPLAPNPFCFKWITLLKWKPPFTGNFVWFSGVSLDKVTEFGKTLYRNTEFYYNGNKSSVGQRLHIIMFISSWSSQNTYIVVRAFKMRTMNAFNGYHSLLKHKQ